MADEQRYASLVDVLAQKARDQPADRAYVFVDESGAEQQALTFAELDALAGKLAVRLAGAAPSGERALLAFPPGLEFIVAFFACLKAGLIAVPIMPPKQTRMRDATRSIVLDCAPALCLSTEKLAASLTQVLTDTAVSSPAVMTVELDEVRAAQRPEPCAVSFLQPITRESLAFLQYTSGSTSSPKGVQVSHGNLLANLQMILETFRNDRHSTYVSWVPLYHDMGLILNVLQALYAGALCVLLAPVAFMQRPLAWIRAIDRYRAQIAGAPNFAFDLCVERLKKDALDGVDLSCWRVAFNGAEPVRADTLDNFAKAFEPFGFRRESLYPCYGMAEATLLISGGMPGSGAVTRPVSAAALSDGRVLPPRSADDTKRLVGCGRVLRAEEIAIVDPVVFTRVEQNRTGEIWVRGPHVSRGYWNRPDANVHTFDAHIHGEARGRWLRTGDLGCVDSAGELYITGRLKDLVIIRGVNHYPQDIELTVERSHPALRTHCNAAFSVMLDQQEVLVVVQEVERTWRNNLDFDELIGDIRQALVQQHELFAHDIALIRPGTIPKTTSGKIRRALTKELWLSGALERVNGTLTNSQIDD
ncbi:hypothetical protein WS67_05375 [Burkholderia singularis]|uniref:Uncharacterized protein n=1 Tax=Burkholderia singularis TaxID=1503053 RepID=A0A124P9Q9_9BURK|nr:fatty acyl-AMP ligase [Burkholderia singularis]KVE29287.1 hypothetical protein WS67_05375 [Burkholderia singularis]